MKPPSTTVEFALASYAALQGNKDLLVTLRRSAYVRGSIAPVEARRACPPISARDWEVGKVPVSSGRFQAISGLRALKPCRS